MFLVTNENMGLCLYMYLTCNKSWNYPYDQKRVSTAGSTELLNIFFIYTDISLRYS